jgi:hypothetical protein
MPKVIRLMIVTGLVIVPVAGAAQSSPADDKPHAPRPEAIAACKDKSEGVACEFDAPRGHVSGTCHKVQTGDMACVHPHHHHDHPDGGTP